MTYRIWTLNPAGTLYRRGSEAYRSKQAARYQAEKAKKERADGMKPYRIFADPRKE